MYKNFREVWPCDLMQYASRQTDTLTIVLLTPAASKTIKPRHAFRDYNLSQEMANQSIKRSIKGLTRSLRFL